jgi:hypothetical protein
VRYPQHDIRIEDFRDSRLLEGLIDAVIGIVPFANIQLDHRGQRFSGCQQTAAAGRSESDEPRVVDHFSTSDDFPTIRESDGDQVCLRQRVTTHNVGVNDEAWDGQKSVEAKVPACHMFGSFRPFSLAEFLGLASNSFSVVVHGHPPS